MKRPVLVVFGVLVVMMGWSSCTREAFYGDWVVKGVVAEGRVTVYGEDEKAAVIGKRITYYANSATFSDNVCRNPHYVRTVEQRQSYELLNHVTFVRLGIQGDSVTRVDIYVDKESRGLWDSVGSTFFIKDGNTLIVFDGGVYFELTRAK